MILLEKKDYEKIYQLYLNSAFFFLLIAAILLNEQEGVVFVNNLKTFDQVYVEHAFGFAQIFGSVDDIFEQNLEQYLLIQKKFTPNKIRLYLTYVPNFIKNTQYDSMRSFRQRFILKGETDILTPSTLELDKKISFTEVNPLNVSLVEDQFGLVARFWKNSIEFIQKSHAVVTIYEGIQASICYAAAVANNCVEIDVLTLPNFRKLGLGRQTVLCFIKNCFEKNLTPMWDCFTNNSGSMMLCKSVGFEPIGTPYQFYTINK